jgi:hypothetical protein
MPELVLSISQEQGWFRHTKTNAANTAVHDSLIKRVYPLDYVDISRAQALFRHTEIAVTTMYLTMLIDFDMN